MSHLVVFDWDRSGKATAAAVLGGGEGLDVGIDGGDVAEDCGGCALAECGESSGSGDEREARVGTDGN